jgi:hypothetical protein
MREREREREREGGEGGRERTMCHWGKGIVELEEMREKWISCEIRSAKKSRLKFFVNQV